MEKLDSFNKMLGSMASHAGVMLSRSRKARDFFMERAVTCGL